MASRNLQGEYQSSWKLAGALLLALFSSAAAITRLAPPRASVSAQSSRPAVHSEHLLEALGHLPLQFEENRGQAPADARFVARGRGFSASFTQQEVLVSLDGGQI